MVPELRGNTLLLSDRIILFSVTKDIFPVFMRVNPSLPQRGRQPRGVPLDSSFRGNFLYLSRYYQNKGRCPAGMG